MGEKIESLPRPGIDKRKRSMKRDEFDFSHSRRDIVIYIVNLHDLIC